MYLIRWLICILGAQLRHRLAPRSWVPFADLTPADLGWPE